MALYALLDSRISVWRLADGSAAVNRLGEPSKTPTKVQAGLRASLDNPRTLLSRDSGAGDRPSGTVLMFVQKKAAVAPHSLLLNDIISVDSGENAGTWWTVVGYFRQVQRAGHLEGYVSPYVGAIPS